MGVGPETLGALVGALAPAPVLAAGAGGAEQAARLPVLLGELGALVLVLGLAAQLSRRIGLSPVPLYLAIGVVAGELVSLGGENVDFVSISAEIGVLLLLLLLGLEFTPTELVAGLRTQTPSAVVDALLNATPGAVAGLALGLGPQGALVLAGVTWVSSSGVVAKVLSDLGRLGNRETPAVLTILVLEDLAMAIYLPVLTVVLAGTALATGATTVGVALLAVTAALVITATLGDRLSNLLPGSGEALLLTLLGLTLVVAALAQQIGVSAAVGAFLVGIAIGGQAAEGARDVLEPLKDLFAAVFFFVVGLQVDVSVLPDVALPVLALVVVTTLTKIGSGWYAASRLGVGRPGRLRAGLVLVARGEFSVVIAGLATAAGAAPEIAAVTTGYVLCMALLGPVLARLSDPLTDLLRLRPPPPPVPPDPVHPDVGPDLEPDPETARQPRR